MYWYWIYRMRIKNLLQGTKEEIELAQHMIRISNVVLFGKEGEIK